MEILRGIEIIDLALYIKEFKALIFSDFHIGFEESLGSEGVLVPRVGMNAVFARLDAIFSRITPEIIIVNGDLKHEFASISRQEWNDSLKLLDYLCSRCKKLILVKGNHDTILGPIARVKGIKIVEHVILGSAVVLHGHKLVDVPVSIKTVIIGHEHPAVLLSDRTRHELYKCFLLGSFHGKNLIVMPSFNLLAEGTNVKKEKLLKIAPASKSCASTRNFQSRKFASKDEFSLLSPFLQQDLGEFRVFVAGDKVYEFGKAKEI